MKPTHIQTESMRFLPFLSLAKHFTPCIMQPLKKILPGVSVSVCVCMCVGGETDRDREIQREREEEEKQRQREKGEERQERKEKKKKSKEFFTPVFIFCSHLTTDEPNSHQ